MTPFTKNRGNYQPRYPKIFDQMTCVSTLAKETLEPNVDQTQKQSLAKLFPKTYGAPLLELQIDKKGEAAPAQPLNIGIVLSGGQAPGGHNVVAGIFDGLTKLTSKNQLIGFVGGPSGVLDNKFKKVDRALVDQYRNLGGFDMLGSGRTKLETPEHFQKCLKVLQAHKLNALVIIGGDDSNTNAALMAEYFMSVGSDIVVVGVPKTIDGDLKNHYVETSFGFDTAVKLYSEIISNIACDAISAKKYYHFIRLMGRAASHITLEAALQTHPNMFLISEEIAAQKKTVYEIVEDLAIVIMARAEQGKNYGIVLIPEGLIEFIPEMRELISNLNDVLAANRDYMQTLKSFTDQSEYLNHKLTKESSYTLAGLPIDIQRQLLMDRDPHGNVQVSLVETEKLLIELLDHRLDELKVQGKFKGKFKTQRHFLGYEGRCAAPTNFDADYAYVLGLTAVALSRQKASGYITAVKNLAAARDEWQAIGVPLTSMMNLESRHNQLKPVIQKSLVSLTSKAFKNVAQRRVGWAIEDDYRFSGAIQYFGPPEICDSVPKTLSLEFGTEDYND